MCAHIKRVTPFAPPVDHVVVDMIVGSWGSLMALSGVEGRCTMTGVDDPLGGFAAPATDPGPPPSCTLGREGVFCQDWLREDS